MHAENWLNQRRQLWEGHLDRLGELLESKGTTDAADGSGPSAQGDKT